MHNNNNKVSSKCSFGVKVWMQNMSCHDAAVVVVVAAAVVVVTVVFAVVVVKSALLSKTKIFFKKEVNTSNCR